MSLVVHRRRSSSLVVVIAVVSVVVGIGLFGGSAGRRSASVLRCAGWVSALALEPPEVQSLGAGVCFHTHRTTDDDHRRFPMALPTANRPWRPMRAAPSGGPCSAPPAPPSGTPSSIPWAGSGTRSLRPSRRTSCAGRCRSRPRRSGSTRAAASTTSFSTRRPGGDEDSALRFAPGGGGWPACG